MCSWCVLICLSIVTDQNQRLEEKVYLAYLSILQFIIKWKQGRNSRKAGTWKKNWSREHGGAELTTETMEGHCLLLSPWGNTAYCWVPGGTELTAETMEEHGLLLIHGGTWLTADIMEEHCFLMRPWKNSAYYRDHRGMLLIDFLLSSHSATFLF